MSTRPAYQREKLEIPTSKAHRRQTLWQIWVPLGVMVAIILALAVWASFVTAGNPVAGGEWAAISTIFLICIYFVIALVILAVLAGGIWLAAKLLNLTPYYSLRAQTFLYRLQGSIIKFSNSGAKLVIAVMSAWAGIRTALKDIGVVKEAE